jgi:hypothetical protein
MANTSIATVPSMIIKGSKDLLLRSACLALTDICCANISVDMLEINEFPALVCGCLLRLILVLIATLFSRISAGSIQLGFGFGFFYGILCKLVGENADRLAGKTAMVLAAASDAGIRGHYICRQCKQFRPTH